jgi:hypothetical protein
MAESTGAPLTLFIPLRIDRDRVASDLDRFRALALPSFERHLAPGLVHEIVVVVPPSDVREASAALAGPGPFAIRVLDETVLGVDTAGAPGWVLQQILKLGAPNVVTTPWFLTVDADVVATRAMDADFLLPGGRAIWEQERAAEHMNWWRSSASVLGVPVAVEDETPAFGATPAVMSTAGVRSLWAAIDRAHPGAGWSRTLVDLQTEGWTEYTLYWTHLVASGQAPLLYSDAARRPYALADSVWTSDDLADPGAALDRVFAPDADHGFYVFQSNLEVPLDDTVRLLRPYLGGGAITDEERRRWDRHARAHARRALRYRLRARARRLLGR